MAYRWLRKQGLLPSSCATFLFFVFSYPAISGAPNQEIRIQQEALIWTTDYEGLIDGKLGHGTISAIKRFQARLGNPETGSLTSSELETLVKQGFAKRDAVGFKQYTDRNAGVSVGIPETLLPVSKDVAWGRSWYNKAKGLAIDTLRFKSDVSFHALYDKLSTINNRRIAYKRYVDDNWFVIAAFEKDAAVYVRANLVHIPGQPDEIRGFSIWMSNKRPDDFQSIAPAMLSSFRSDTDTSRDVFSSGNRPSRGGDLIAVPPQGSSIKTGPVREALQVGPIKTLNNNPPSVGNCFQGLGDCPLSAFAFK